MNDIVLREQVEKLRNELELINKKAPFAIAQSFFFSFFTYLFVLTLFLGWKRRYKAQRKILSACKVCSIFMTPYNEINLFILSVEYDHYYHYANENYNQGKIENNSK